MLGSEAGWRWEGSLSALVCASWGLTQALAKMKESATKGFMLTVIFH